MPSVKSTDFARNSQANLSSPLQLNADFHWIADTSATSHMTPHCHWFKSYTHYGTPIHFANNIVIYSASVGNVVFEPIVKEKQVKAVEFSRVFYVPDLRSNLLSCLYLTRHKGITINISSHSMIFRQGRKCKGTSNTPLRSPFQSSGATRKPIQHYIVILGLTPIIPRALRCHPAPFSCSDPGYQCRDAKTL